MTKYNTCRSIRISKRAVETFHSLIFLIFLYSCCLLSAYCWNHSWGHNWRGGWNKLVVKRLGAKESRRLAVVWEDWCSWRLLFDLSPCLLCWMPCFHTRKGTWSLHLLPPRQRGGKKHMGHLEVKQLIKQHCAVNGTEQTCWAVSCWESLLHCTAILF